MFERFPARVQNVANALCKEVAVFKQHVAFGHALNFFAVKAAHMGSSSQDQPPYLAADILPSKSQGPS